MTSGDLTLDRPGYGRGSIAVHWLTVLLLVGVYACMELREFYPRGSDIREALKTWHYQLGLTVFILAWIRLALRLRPGAPRLQAPSGPAWTVWLARATHLFLYAMILALPLAGWMILSAEGDPIPFWGLSLPPLTAPNHGLAETLEEGHELIATLGYAVIALHAVGALVHHYVFKDAVLVSMAPWVKRGGAAS